MKPTCPECGSDQIIEWNTVYAAYPVTELDENGNPEDYGAADVAWETADAVNEDPYSCQNCKHDFDNFDHQQLLQPGGTP